MEQKSFRGLAEFGKAEKKGVSMQEKNKGRRKQQQTVNYQLPE
jgi:hypothetical protein